MIKKKGSKYVVTNKEGKELSKPMTKKNANEMLAAIEASKAEKEKKKASNLSIGFIMFAIAAIVETTIPSNIIVIARVLMTISVFFWYKGFSA